MIEHKVAQAAIDLCKPMLADGFTMKHSGECILFVHKGCHAMQFVMIRSILDSEDAVEYVRQTFEGIR